MKFFLIADDELQFIKFWRAAEHIHDAIRNAEAGKQQGGSEAACNGMAMSFIVFSVALLHKKILGSAACFDQRVIAPCVVVFMSTNVEHLSSIISVGNGVDSEINSACGIESEDIDRMRLGGYR